MRVACTEAPGVVVVVWPVFLSKGTAEMGTVQVLKCVLRCMGFICGVWDVRRTDGERNASGEVLMGTEPLGSRDTQ